MNYDEELATHLRKLDLKTNAMKLNHIREMLRRRVPGKTIAKLYDLSPARISQIKKNGNL